MWLRSVELVVEVRDCLLMTSSSSAYEVRGKEFMRPGWRSEARVSVLSGPGQCRLFR